MTNPFIAHPRLSDAGTLTTGNELASLPASNLQDMQPSRRWRTSNLSNVWYQIDLGSAQTIDCIALISCNAAASDTYRVRASADSSPTTSPDYDSGSVNFYPSATKPSDGLFTHFHAFHLPASAQTWRYWRVDITSTSADGYWEQGRALLGSRLDLSIQYGFGRAHAPADVAEQTPWGGFLGEARGRPRVWNIQAQFFTEADARLVHKIDAYRGIADDVFVVESPDETTDLHLCMMQCSIMEPTTIDQPDFGIRLKRYPLREIL